MADFHHKEGRAYYRNGAYAAAYEEFAAALVENPDDWQAHFACALSAKSWALERIENFVQTEDDVSLLQLPTNLMEAMSFETIVGLLGIMHMEPSSSLVEKRVPARFTASAIAFFAVCADAFHRFQHLKYVEHLDAVLAIDPSHPECLALRDEFTPVQLGRDEIGRYAAEIRTHNGSTSVPGSRDLFGRQAGAVCLLLVVFIGGWHAISQRPDVSQPPTTPPKSADGYQTSANDPSSDQSSQAESLSKRRLGNFSVMVPKHWPEPVHEYRADDRTDVWTQYLPDRDAFARIEYFTRRPGFRGQGDALDQLKIYPQATHQKFLESAETKRYRMIRMEPTRLFGRAYLWEYERQLSDRGLRHRKIIYFAVPGYGGALVLETPPRVFNLHEEAFDVFTSALEIAEVAQ
jgi:tetratricopeptide (TPR) repeat protein